MAAIEKLQRTLKELSDLFFADFMWGEQLVQVEVRKSAIRHLSREKLPQAAGTDGSEVSDFFEDHALQWIFEDAWIEQIAYLNARPALDQHGAEKTQRVSFQLKSAVRFFSMHSKDLHYVSLGPISCQDDSGIRKDGNCCASPARQS